MKRRFNPVLLLLVLQLGMMPALAGTESGVLEVEGMTCSGCAAGLESMLKGFAGVSQARIDYGASRAYLRYDPEQADLAKIATGISREGISATVMPDETVPASMFSEAAQTVSLTDEQMSRAATYVIEQLVQTGSVDAIERSDIEAATGVAVPDSELSRLQSMVIEELEAKHPAVYAKLTDGNRCAEYGACSLHGNLAGATGETLEMYKREKAEDGKVYADYKLPEFEAKDLNGNVVRSSDLIGKPTVVTLLAGHCVHCHDSLPILNEAVKVFGPQGVRVVGIVINSGSVENVNDWLPQTNPNYDVWVFNDDSLGDLLGSHLVPSYFFVDAQGNITQKLVGFQDKDLVLEKFSEFASTAAANNDTIRAGLGAR